MKRDTFHKKEQCLIYCPQLSNEDDWVEGKYEIILSGRKNGIKVILLDSKEEVKEMIRELKGHKGIDRLNNVLE